MTVIKSNARLVLGAVAGLVYLSPTMASAADTAPAIATTPTLPLYRFFFAFLGMAAGGWITTKMPQYWMQREPYGFIWVGGAAGFILADVLFVLFTLSIVFGLAFFLHRSWGDIGPLVQEFVRNARGDQPVLMERPVIAAHLESIDVQQARRQQAEHRRQQREQEARSAYEQIVSQVLAQAERFGYSEELARREIEHRFSQWCQQRGHA